MPLKVDKTIWQTSGRISLEKRSPKRTVRAQIRVENNGRVLFLRTTNTRSPNNTPDFDWKCFTGGRTALVCCFLREILEFERKACNYVMWVFIVSNLLHNFIFLKLQPFSFWSFHLFLKLQPFIFSSFHLFWNYNLDEISSFHLFIFLNRSARAA